MEHRLAWLTWARIFLGRALLLEHAKASPHFLLFPSLAVVLLSCCNVVHRHEANYVHVVYVDDLDYDDYYRFRRVEKQLAN